MTSIPLFYYPTTIVSIDDDPLFTKSVMSSLIKSGYSLKTFDHPKDGLKFFQDYTSSLSKTSFLHRFVE